MHVDQTTNGWLFTCINIIYVVINGCVWAAVQPLGYSLKFVSWNTGRKREIVNPSWDGHGFRTCPTIQCCLHHTELPVFTLSCSSLSRDENNSWRYNHTILILAFAWIQKKLLQGQMPTKLSTHEPTNFQFPWNPVPNKTQRWSTVRKYIVILKGLSVWQYNTKITKFDLFNLS